MNFERSTLSQGLFTPNLKGNLKFFRHYIKGKGDGSYGKLVMLPYICLASKNGRAGGAITGNSILNWQKLPIL